jgi:hypothetical protein
MLHVWPGGLDWQKDKRQHRDMILLYAMGWLDALAHAGCEDHLAQVAEEYKYTADFNWWPDESWRWV